ncbi:hypothetical protein LEP1GSC185_0037 [Leptospira licerasiae serovar Varillal str. VAR 010]|uniref:Lipoprotein n=2 Tax=Leptospira licerasiae TaxID=447106 RepID=A0ABP2RCI3_9LEPT|nr:hypothetical protein LEP1GSC185_0037 [Leptospira licerasiae serovar Varillal str. VAR 010]EJZ42247.1 putative lipoprotein [Leptospira licerasiae str. MMD4847]
MKNRIKFEYILLFLVSFQACAYGTLGNSTEERSTELQALFRIMDERRAIISPWLYYSDDQGDSDIGSFLLNGNTYQIQLTENEVVLESISMLFKAPENSFSVSSSSADDKYHVFHSGGSETPTTGTGSYSKKYGIKGSFSPGDISISDFNALTGPVKKQSLSPFPSVPYGTLEHIYGEFSDLLLTFQIFNGSTTKTVHVELREAEFQVEASCDLEIPYKKNVPFSIGFRTDGLLSQRAGSSFSILDAIFALSGSEITINDFQNTTIYSEILENLDTSGQVMVLYSCF